jgi:hypothetical protein
MQNVAVYGLDEILSKIDQSDNKLNELRQLIKTNSFAKRLLLSAVDDKWVDVDINEIKTTNPIYHRSLAGTSLLSRATTQIFEGIFFAPASSKIPKRTKTLQYKNMTEMLCESEAKLLKAILLKNVESLYPTLTHELICEALKEEQ